MGGGRCVASDGIAMRHTATGAWDPPRCRCRHRAASSEAVLGERPMSSVVVDPSGDGLAAGRPAVGAGSAGRRGSSAPGVDASPVLVTVNPADTRSKVSMKSSFQDQGIAR
jgi:hypothetical protein